MTRKPKVLPRIAADGTKDNSWPFGTGIATINRLQESQNTHRQDDTSKRYVINLISCILYIYIYIQVKIFHVINFVFKNKQKSFDDE